MKGTKICPSCKSGTGCRTHRCKCGYNFLTNTSEKSIDKLASIINPTKHISVFAGLKDYSKNSHEQEISRKFYDGGLKSIISVDGKILYRKRKTFMGAKLGYPPIQILFRDGDKWIPFPKLFYSLKKARKYVEKKLAGPTKKNN